MNDGTTRPPGRGAAGGQAVEYLVGATIAEYVIEELASSGGHGSVYRARHREHGGLVAIKVMHPSLLWLSGMAERFVREVDFILRLRHPNIVEVHELGARPDGTLFYVMEYLRGTTLRAYLAARGRLSPDEALAILEPVCAALSAAHEAGIVHRDVKASNIMICEDEPSAAGEGPPRVKLLDFGIAKLLAPEPGQPGLTSIGQQLGTPSIMAPEQILCGPIDARTDVYALGALLHVLVTGRPPFESAAPGDLAQKHLAAPPPRPSQRAPVSPAIDAIVLRCLDKKPERRFESVLAFLDALRASIHVDKPDPTTNPKSRRAVGIHVEVRFPEGADEVDEGLVDALAETLERGEACMRAGGLTLVTVTSTEILGVRLLSDEPSREAEQRCEAVQFALTLHAALAAPRAGSAVRVGVSIHVDAVNADIASEMEIASGDLARTEAWAAGGDVDGLCATEAAIAGLSGFVVEPGPGHALVVRRPGARRAAMATLTEISRGASSTEG